MDSARQADLDALKKAYSFLSETSEDSGEIPLVFDVAKEVSQVFGVGDIEDALNCGLLRYPYIGMVRQGQQVPPGRFTETRRVARTDQRLYADAQAVSEEFNGGSSIILKAVEEWHRPVRALVAKLGNLLGTRVKADVFFTPAGSQALAVHRDEYHVFAVQLHGEKAWLLQGLPQESSWRGGPASLESLGDPTHLTLKTGQGMFLERGMAHSASAQEGPSVHISFVVRTFRLAEQLEKIFAEIIRDEARDFTSLDPDTVLFQMSDAISRIRERSDHIVPQDVAAGAVRHLKESSQYKRVSFQN